MGEQRKCYRCHERKPPSAYRISRGNRSGLDHVCRACRRAEYEALRASSFGPLPGAPGSAEWMAEVKRRAQACRSERTDDTASDISA